MKKYFNILMLISCIMVSNMLIAQTPGSQLSNKISQKMKDTLSLTEQQRLTIYNLNMQIFNAKQTVRQAHAGSDSIGYFIQRIENKRDSLYKTVLTEDKFLLYRQKKRNLLNNN